MQNRHSLLIVTLLLMCFPCFGAPKVVVTIKPIHALVASIMEGVEEPTLILPDSASPHTFQLKPSTLKQLQQAELIIWVGSSLELFMEKPLDQLQPQYGVITLLKIPKLKLLSQRAGRAWEHHHDHDNEHEHHHEHSSIDPHFWLSTDNALVMVDYLSDYLSIIDTPNALVYQNNAKKLKMNIAKVKNTLTTQLANVKNKPFLVYHDGYQYFEDEFQLHAVGTMMLNPHLPLSANGLNMIKQLIQTHHVKCVFRETEFNDTMTQQYLSDVGVTVAELDPLGARLPKGPGIYEKIMLAIGDTLQSCLQQ